MDKSEHKRKFVQFDLMNLSKKFMRCECVSTLISSINNKTQDIEFAFVICHFALKLIDRVKRMPYKIDPVL